MARIRKASVTKESEATTESPPRRGRSRSRGGSVVSTGSAEVNDERSPKRARKGSKGDLGADEVVVTSEDSNKLKDSVESESVPKEEPTVEAESKPLESTGDDLEETEKKEEESPESIVEKKDEEEEEENNAPSVENETAKETEGKEETPVSAASEESSTAPATANAIYGGIPSVDAASVSTTEHSEARPVVEAKPERKEGGDDDWYSVLSPDGGTQVIDIPKNKCGSIIGPKGSTINRLQVKSGAQVKLNQDFPEGHPCKLTITGQPHAVSVATDLVKKVLKDGPQAIHDNTLQGGPQVTEIVKCPPNLVGRVVGRQGANIKEVQSRSGARVQLHQNFGEGVDREVNITGTQAAVSSAVELIKWIMDNGPVLPAPGMPLSGASAVGAGTGNPDAASVVVECPKSCIGRVIGRGGETITRIQRTSNARVQIDQNVPEGAPVKVNISGSEANVQEAIRMVQDVMINGNAAHGGGGGYGQQQRGYGGHAAGAYGPGGGGGNPQGGMYGQVPSYGGPPQAYGAAQGYGSYNPYGAAAAMAPAPASIPAHPGPASALPPGWFEYQDQSSGKPYFHNPSTGTTTWDRPH